MYAQIEKSKENNSRAVANSVSQKKSNGKQGFRFLVNRPKSVSQRKLQEFGNNNPQQIQLGSFQGSVLQKRKNPKKDMRTIQCSTVLGYTNPTNRSGTDTINSYHHDRVQHTDAHRNAASVQSGYAADRSDVTGDCNHAVPYKMIKDHVGSRLLSAPNNVVNAVGIINPLAGAYGSYQAPVTPTVAGIEVGEADLNVAVDQLIPTAANNVQNLFYWPDHTGDNSGTAIDQPKGVGKYPGGVAAYKAFLSVHETRLRADGLIP